MEQVVHTSAVRVEDRSFEEHLDLLLKARENLAGNFLTIGQILGVIKRDKLYEQGGFSTFHQFLKNKQISIVPQDAERFILMSEDPHFQKHAVMGFSKMLELLKLPAPERQKILSEGAKVGGQIKPLDEMSLSELKEASREIKRRDKTRCDRCGRWVDEVKEIDGKFYGSGGAHSCFEYEMEERRAISAGRIPAAQLDMVLDSLKLDKKAIPAEAEPLQWLPESLYQLYGQILQENQSGEVSESALTQEQEVLKKLMNLCQTRLKDIQETLSALKELEAED